MNVVDEKEEERRDRKRKQKEREREETIESPVTELGDESIICPPDFCFSSNKSAISCSSSSHFSIHTMTFSFFFVIVFQFLLSFLSGKTETAVVKCEGVYTHNVTGRCACMH